MERAQLLKRCQNEAIEAADGLLYPEKVVDAIKKAKTVAEVSRIMSTARNTYL